MSNLDHITRVNKRDFLVHIVHDELHICRDLSVLFGIEGYATSYTQRLGQTIAFLGTRRPTVVLLSMTFGRDGGLPLLKKIKQQSPSVIVFMISNGLCQTRQIVSAVKFGACDVFNDLNQHHRMILEVDEAISGQKIASVIDKKPPKFALLTKREGEVLQFLIKGGTNNLVGEELGISPRTIEVHRARIMDKLGARNTADMVRIALS